MRRFLALALALGLVATPLLASAAGNGKVGVLNVGQVLAQSKAGKEVQKELQAFGNQQRAALEKERSKLEKEQKQLKSNASIETKAAQKAAQERFGKDVKAFQEDAQKRRQAFDKKRASFVQPLQAKLQEVVADYAKRHGYDLIVDDSVAIYNADGIDVTNAILKAFNAAQPHAPPPDTSISAGPSSLRGIGRGTGGR